MAATNRKISGSRSACRVALRLDNTREERLRTFIEGARRKKPHVFSIYQVDLQEHPKTDRAFPMIRQISYGDRVAIAAAAGGAE